MKKYTIRFFISGSLLLLMFFPCFSQTDTNTIAGTILDSNSSAVAGASVKIRNKANGKERITQTDEAGNFAVNDLPKGIYQLQIVAKGFSDFSKEISVAENKTETIQLTVGNISEEVTVTATRTELATTETAVPVSVLTEEEIERKNVNTIGDALRDLPGVSTVNEGAFQVRPRIRGLESNRILVLVDGERLNNGRTSTTQSGIELGLVETDQVETLEVVRGSGSVLYGTDALGGTINIITKDAPRNTKGGFRFGASLNGHYDSSQNGRRGNLAVTGSGKYFSFRLAQSLERYENYFAGKAGNKNFASEDGIASDGEVLNSQSHGSNTQLTNRFFLDDSNNFRFNYTRRRAADIGVPTLVGVFNAYFPYSDRDKFSAGYEGINFNDYLARVSANFYYQKQKRNFTNDLNVPAAPPFFPGLSQFSETVTDTNSVGLDLQSNWILGRKNFLTAGLSYFRDENKDERFIDALSPDFRQNPPILVRSFDRSKSVPDASYGSFAFFAQNEFQANGRLKLIGGIRTDFFRSKSEPTQGFAIPSQIPANVAAELNLNGLENGLDVAQTAVTGDFGAVYKINNTVNLTARIGRSFRVPNLFERFFSGEGSIGGFVIGNPDLEPESGINFDGGVKVNNSKFAGSFVYFNNTYKNFLFSRQIFDSNNVPVLSRAGGLFQTDNISRARIQGFEAELQVPVKIGLGFLTPGGNISYLRGDDLAENEPLNTITPLKTVLNLRWQNLLANYYIDWTTRIVNKQERLSADFLQANGGAEPGFTVSDLRGGYTFKRENYRLNLNVGVTNIFDRFYREQFVFAPARGRSFVFGTTLELFQ